MAHKQELGRWGEDTAAAYLQAQGYRIVDRNVRFRHGEIDIVASIGDTLVFVEVKTRQSTRQGLPQESVHGLKQYRLLQLAARYLQSRHLSQERACRFDVIAIQPAPQTTDAAPQLEHFVNAF